LFLLGAGIDPALVGATTAVGGLLMIGIGLRLLEVRQIRVVSFLPALILVPLFVVLAEAVTASLL